jgi:hypothetical protein
MTWGFLVLPAPGTKRWSTPGCTTVIWSGRNPISSMSSSRDESDNVTIGVDR